MLKKFSKYHGAGNDFILFNDFEQDFPEDQIPHLCHRHFGIGADGLILVRHSKLSDFEMVYYNADGSKAGMCGNGLRCFVHFLIDQGIVQNKYLIEVAGKVLTVKSNRGKISTFLPGARVLHWDVILNNRLGFVVDTGVPHLVIFTEDEVDVEREGALLRHHPLLQPEGANVNFAKMDSLGQLVLSTFERGVERETMACGTGAAAAAFVANRLGYSGKEVTVRTRSQAVLEISLGSEIEIAGPSRRVFDGQINL